MSEWSVVAIILEFQAQPNDLRQPIAPATDTLVNPSQVPRPNALHIYGSSVGQLTQLISPVSTVKGVLCWPNKARCFCSYYKYCQYGSYVVFVPQGNAELILPDSVVRSFEYTAVDVN